MNLDNPCAGQWANIFESSCRGCGRTAQEIASWVTMTNEQKEIVLTRISRQAASLKVP